MTSTPRLKELKLRMQAYGIKPVRKRGQNFLIDNNLLRAIVQDAAVMRDDCVLEIGTGSGALTGFLCEQAGLVVSIEIDRRLFELGGDVLEETPNLMALLGDALQKDGSLNAPLCGLLHAWMAHGLLDVGESEFAAFRLPKRPPERGRGALKVVANLPYSVGTMMVLAMLESELPIESMTLMLQFEVAQKIAARMGAPEYGLPALLVSRFGKTRMLRRVPAKVFWPKPRVDSAILRITPDRENRPDMAAYRRLKGLAHLAFQHRRKGLANSLLHADVADRTTIDAWLTRAGIESSERPEAISAERLQILANLPDVAEAVERAMGRDAETLARAAAKKARRREWQQRIYGDEE